ncbi:MAG: hypothetical protein AAGU75_02235, partial [Bacillota bacterium]
ESMNIRKYFADTNFGGEKMDKSFDRDNFKWLGIDKKYYDLDKVRERALSEHDSEDQENDTKKPRKKH